MHVVTQLDDLPHDFFSDALISDNFLGRALAALATTLVTSAALVPSEVRRAALSVFHACKRRFEWEVYRLPEVLAACDTALADETRQAGMGGEGADPGMAQLPGSVSSANAQSEVEFTTMEELLAALAQDGDGDLPAIVEG